MCSRVVIDHLHNLGKTFRLFMDGFSNKMNNEVSPLPFETAPRLRLICQEMILHALYENGQVAPVDFETHIKDDIEREEAKVNEIARKMKTAYHELVSVN